MVVEKNALDVSQSKNCRKKPTVCSKIFINYIQIQIYSIFKTSFIYYGVILMIFLCLNILIFNLISTILNLIFKSLFLTLIFGDEKCIIPHILLSNIFYFLMFVQLYKDCCMPTRMVKCII